MNNYKDEDFWITNISNRDIALHDLGVVIRAKTSINLLNKRHYSLSLETLNNSLNSGSLSQKKRYVIKRVSPPTLNSLTFKIAVDQDAIIPSRTHSIYEMKEETYDELLISDEQFAEANAETVNMDKQPPIKGK